ncbi:MAG: hypothetical protein ACE5H7_13265 [Acidiferrobacterales bacterium]
MSEIIHEVPELVTVTWEEHLRAIVIRWDTLYREDAAVRDALEFCFDYVRRNEVKNWVADVSAAKAQMSAADEQWSDQYFIKTLATLGLNIFVLVTAPSKAGEASPIEEWMEGARREIGGSLAMLHATSMDEVRTIIYDGASSPEG